MNLLTGTYLNKGYLFTGIIYVYFRGNLFTGTIIIGGIDSLVLI